MYAFMQHWRFRWHCQPLQGIMQVHFMVLHVKQHCVYTAQGCCRASRQRCCAQGWLQPLSEEQALQCRLFVP